jgi:hypothetical protein
MPGRDVRELHRSKMQVSSRGEVLNYTDSSANGAGFTAVHKSYIWEKAHAAPLVVPPHTERHGVGIGTLGGDGLSVLASLFMLGLLVFAAQVVPIFHRMKVQVAFHVVNMRALNQGFMPAVRLSLLVQ